LLSFYLEIGGVTAISGASFFGELLFFTSVPRPGLRQKFISDSGTKDKKEGWRGSSPWSPIYKQSLREELFYLHKQR
jgi:hypothetical protein